MIPETFTQDVADTLPPADARAARALGTALGLTADECAALYGAPVAKARKLDPRTGKPPGYYARQAVRFARAQEKMAAAWDDALARSGIPRAQVGKEWESKGDDRVRGTHRGMHGTVAPLDEPFILPSGTVTWGAPAEPNCRCRTRVFVAGGGLAKAARDVRELMDAETLRALDAALAAAWAPEPAEVAYEAAVAEVSAEARALVAKGAAVGVPVPPLVAEVIVDTMRTGEPLAKTAPAHRIFAGWANVLTKDDGVTPYEDSQRDIIDESDLLVAAERYVTDWRRLGDTHTRKDGLGEAVESFMLTKAARDAMQLANVPTGWLLAFHATDDTVWGRVERGEYQGLSIGGSADRELVAKSGRRRTLFDVLAGRG